MATKKVLKKKAVTIEEVETKAKAPKVNTPEIVEEEVKERSYDELVLLPRKEFLEVQAQVRAGKAKFKPQ